MEIKRLRIFAGPNGSGKSTLVQHIIHGFNLSFGCFVNADNIERELKTVGYFDFSPTGIAATEPEFQQFAAKSTLGERVGSADWLQNLRLTANRISFSTTAVNSYLAALIADFLREKLLETGRSFSFETVFSDSRKLDFVKKAKAAGYRVYVYFVATDDPAINVARVQERVAAGGHGVAVDKILSRYEKSLALLPQLIRLADRAYLFDNSEQLEFAVEITGGSDISLQTEDIPNWVNKALS